MAVFNLFKLSMLLTLLSDVKLGSWPGFLTQKQTVAVGGFPPQCNRIECPPYDVIHSGDGYEIRVYNSSNVWATTSLIEDISFVNGTRTGFLQLFNYIQGGNSYNQKIEMTAPVVTEIVPSDGPFCESKFLVSFYVPKKNQADPPPAKGLNIQKWGPNVAVRQFSGFVKDSDIGVEAAALSASLSGTVWWDAIQKSYPSETSAMVYSVAQYNSPFEFDNRVNEIWFFFYM